MNGARLLLPSAGQIVLGSLDLTDWEAAALRRHRLLVPQRAALMAGTVQKALTIADPLANDAILWAASVTVELAEVIRAKSGLEMRHGPHGGVLSGGEARRLVLAHALLRRTSMLLLDEPTEGLDESTACEVLAGLRRHLPYAAILTASHLRVELA